VPVGIGKLQPLDPHPLSQEGLLPHHPGGLALAKAKTLIRVALDILSCFMIALWGTLALQNSMAVLLAPASKCLLTDCAVD
jgi:hypothetical protein